MRITGARARNLIKYGLNADYQPPIVTYIVEKLNQYYNGAAQLAPS